MASVEPPQLREPPSKRARASPGDADSSEDSGYLPSLSVSDTSAYGRSGGPSPPRLSARRPSLSPSNRYTPEMGAHSPRFAPPHELPPLVQRRGHPGKAGRLHIDPTAAPQGGEPDGHTAAGGRPVVSSAPSHQLRFAPPSRIAPPGDALPPPGTSALREEGAGGSGTPMHAPHSSAPRLNVPQAATLPSPAYSTSHFGQQTLRAMHSDTRPGELGAPQPDSARDAPPKSPMINKMHFLSLFSDFFDSLQDSRTLKANLEYQIRSSNTLLQTLQRSNRVLEETVDRRVREETASWHARVERLEEQLERTNAELARLAERSR